MRMNKTMQLTSKRNFGALLALVFCMPLLPGCAFHGDGVSGHVYEIIDPNKPVEGENIRPLADAYVVAIWDGTVPLPASATSVCLAITLVRSDANGQFHVPGWFKFPKLYPVTEVRQPNGFAHKAGFERIFPTSNSSAYDRYMKKSTESPELRLRYLARTISRICSDRESEEARMLAPLYTTVYEEAKLLPATSGSARGDFDQIKYEATKPN